MKEHEFIKFEQEPRKEPETMNKEFDLGIDLLADCLRKFTGKVGWPPKAAGEEPRRLWENTLTETTIQEFKKIAGEVLRREFDKEKQRNPKDRWFEFRLYYFRGHGTVYGTEILERAGITQLDVPSGLDVIFKPGEIIFNPGMTEPDYKQRAKYPQHITIE